MKGNLLDLFYNYIVREAAMGRVDCFLKYNLIFNTKIPEEGIEFCAFSDNTDLVVPTLMIRNRREFDQLLIKYVQKALDFYDDDNFYEEVRKSNYLENAVGISREKLIMTLLWFNATIEDFNDPCSYLKKRIAFFDLGDMQKYISEKVIGYSEILKSSIKFQVKKSRIESETPYFACFSLQNLEGGGEYIFPNVYFGTSLNNGYIYAIQSEHDRENRVKDAYEKKLNRKLYQVNSGLDVLEDTFENYGSGNLKDITPSFLVAANMMLGLFRSNGISRVKVSSILVSRWNSKCIALDYRRKMLQGKKTEYLQLNDMLEEYYQNSIRIQSNLTEKFLRVFRRLGYHHSSVQISGYPYEVDSNLDLKLSDDEDVCNNELLGETYLLSSDSYIKKR